MKKYVFQAIFSLYLLNFSPNAYAAEAETQGGLQIKSTDGNFQGNLSGRVHFHAESIDENDEANTGQVGGGGTLLRRIRLVLKGKFQEKWEGGIDLEFAPTTLVRDAYIAYNTEYGKLAVGQLKIPIGMNELTSSRSFMFVERSHGSEINPRWRRGVSWLGAHGHFSYAANVFDWQDVADNTQEASSIGVAGRVTYTPIREKDRWLHVGVSGLRIPDHADTAKVMVRSSYFNSRVAKPIRWADVADPKESTYSGVEVAGVLGSVTIATEYLAANIQDHAQTDHRVGSYHAEMSWFPTGESRPYKASNGTFDLVTPLNTKTGAWEMAVRYMHIDGARHLRGGTVQRGGALDDVTFGVNWYANKQVRVMLNYTLETVKQSTQSSFGTQAQDGSHPQGVMLAVHLELI